MNEIIIARIRFLIIFLLFSFFLSLRMFIESPYLKIYFLVSFLYSALLYYCFKKNILQEFFLISFLDEFFIFTFLYLIKGIEVKFLFLIYFPVIKEVIYKRYNSAYILSFLSFIILILFSIFITPFIPLRTSFSLLPFSFLIPYVSVYYSKEKGG